MDKKLIEQAYEIAKARYAAIGIDTEEALAKLQNPSSFSNCFVLFSILWKINCFFFNPDNIHHKVLFFQSI